MLRIIAVLVFVLSACSQAPICRRVTYTHLDPAKGIFMPHWHLCAGDVISKADGKTRIRFKAGGEVEGPDDKMILIEEPCKW